MSVLTSNPPGTFCWLDLGTTDAAAAKTFYTSIFGWTFVEYPMGADGVYTMFQKNGKNVAALFSLSKEMLAMGVPTMWKLYIAVANVDDATKKAVSLGAKVLMPVMDVFDSGRTVVIEDPAGAKVSFWEAKNHIGVELKNEPGAISWTEISVNDPDAATKFYSAMFGWGTEEMQNGIMPYTQFTQAGQAFAGMMKIDPSWGNVPPNWMAYIAVENTNATAKQVESLGGKIPMPPMVIPNVGTFALILDPQGAMISLLDNKF